MENVQFTRVLITPSRAKMYLEGNISNRAIRKPYLMRYVDDMRNGRWVEDTAEPIKIAKSGRILDGQTRLHAIVLANASLHFHVATGLDDDVFTVLDTGRGRNAPDIFTIAGVKNSNTIPSIIAYFNLLEQNRRMNQQVNYKKTNAELLEQYQKDEVFWQNIARKTAAWYQSFAKILTPSVIGGFYAHFYKLNPLQADEFMEQLCTGINLSSKPIQLLRNKLMQDKMSIRKMQTTMKMALIIKSWNYHLKKQEPKILKFDTVSEKFPAAIR